MDLSLPEDHKDNKRFGAGGNMKIYSGCGKWGIDDWVGLLYPEGTKSAAFLENYLSHFNSIELNATFYRLSRTNIARWAELAEGKDFKYCPKFSQRVSHLKRLNEVEENINYFIESVYEMKDSLGMPFLQMPDNFTPKYFERIQKFVEELPDDLDVAIELRHKDWFGDESASKELYDLFDSKGQSLIITDTAKRRDVIHQRLTSDKVFIRFQGYGMIDSDFKRMDDWVERLKIWDQNGVKEVYFFCHQGEEVNTPKTVDYFLKKVNEEMGKEVERPKFIG